MSVQNPPTSGPPQLPPLVKGQVIRSGPYNVTVTDEMVAQREKENQELYRAWMEAQQRRAMSLGDDEDNKYAEEFKNVSVRRSFIRKVFCILSMQLLFTASVIACFMFIDEAKKFMILYWYLWIVALILFTIFYCTISCSEQARRQPPCNYICLMILTVSMAYLAAFVSVFYSIEIVLLAVGMTASITFIISLLATFSKFDLTMRAGLMTIVGLMAILAILVMSIILIFTQIRVLSLAIAIIATLLMCMYLYFDIQTIMGGRRVELSPDEVVYATTQIYVDIILLYQYLLMFMGFVHD